MTTCGQTQPATQHCQAITKSGAPCRNRKTELGLALDRKTGKLGIARLRWIHTRSLNAPK